jgi:hypothetical protein
MRTPFFSARRLAALGAAALLSALPLALGANAQSGALTLDWWSVDGGGVVASSNGPYTLSGSVGQADASVAATGGPLTLEGGFWERLAPSGVHLPLVAAAAPAPAPDLVVESVAISPARTSFRAGETVELLVTVANRGDAPAAPFWVDLYINPSAPPTAANQVWFSRCALDPCVGLAWGVREGLAPGARVTLSSRVPAPDYTYWPGWLPAGATAIYAYADSWNAATTFGAVVERDEGNNLGMLGGLSVGGTNPALAAEATSFAERPALAP